MSFPIYILPFGIVYPRDFEDITHPEFWEQSVAELVASRYKIPVYAIKNSPYAFKRARVVGNTVYYGERYDDKLILKVRKALRNPKLNFAYDEHEKRLPEDMLHVKGIITPSRSKRSADRRQ